MLEYHRPTYYLQLYAYYRHLEEFVRQMYPLDETFVLVKIGTGIGTTPAWVLTDSITIGRWPVRGCAWADRKDAESWVVQ